MALRCRSCRLMSTLFVGVARWASSSSHSYRTHTCGELSLAQVGEKVTLCGWTKKKRSIGGGLEVTFVPLTDSTGSAQLTLDKEKWSDLISSVRAETVVRVSGTVQARPEKDQRGTDDAGAIEVVVDHAEILNQINGILPFAPHSKGLMTTEELNLRERPLYLRTSHMQHNLRKRSQLSMAMREFLIHSHNFVEVETPTLFRRTSETGSREFIVPTRKAGKFYSLPQSPQQFKQLLMVGGVDRYFQFARCYRDEDLRSDRQPEFTQVDLEMSFVDANGVMNLAEELISAAVSRTFSHLDITSSPFPRMTYNEAMQKYGTDKPDTRKDTSDSSKLNFLWVTDFPLFERNSDGKLESTHHFFTAPVAEDEELLLSGDQTKLDKVRGQHYDLVVNGVEVGGGSIRMHRPQLQEFVLKNILGISVSEFSGFLRSLGYGCPPHGGIALGFDRLVSLLCQVNNIKEVIAFPKSSAGSDLLMEAPAKITKDVLRDYHI